MPTRIRNSRTRGRNTSQPLLSVTGTVSRSQLVGVFGVGSLYDLRIYSSSGQWVTSVTIGGLDYWNPDEMTVIRERALEHALQTDHFIQPLPSEERSSRGINTAGAVPTFRFPLWLVCSECARLGRIDREFRVRNGKPQCADSSCRGNGVPVRLVATCFDPNLADATTDMHPGHLEDFPWHWWAHSRAAVTLCNPDRPTLRLSGRGESAGLSGLRVECLDPKCRTESVGRTLEGVFSKDAFARQPCSGGRPWLKDHEQCGRGIRALMRGASNVYFPVVASAISIPPNSTACLNEVGRIWRRTIRPHLAPDGSDSAERFVTPAKNASPVLRKFTDQQVLEAISLHLRGPNDGSEDLPKTEEEQRAIERTAIVEGRSDEDAWGASIFQADPVPREELLAADKDAARFIDRVVLINRLREVRVLRGFQRLARGITKDSYSSECAPVSRARKKWLPAVEVHGEGIYVELDPAAVIHWAASELVKARYALFRRHLPGPLKDVSPEFVLIHTLAHLLIVQLSLDCGYSSASLRERLYVREGSEGTPWYGLMIFTATASSDGTLGGLVRQGRPDLLLKTLRTALENAEWCSSDPLCIESEGQGMDAMNLAACHSCCVISETSCEHRNLLLDRALVVGTPDDPGVGFFRAGGFLDQKGDG